MRELRYAKTFGRDLNALASSGAQRFGKAVAETKIDDLLATVLTFIWPQPKRGKRVRKLKLYKYEIRSAPLVILYDFDANEVRIHTVVHARSDIPNTDLSTVEW